MKKTVPFSLQLPLFIILNKKFDRCKYLDWNPERICNIIKMDSTILLKVSNASIKRARGRVILMENIIFYIYRRHLKPKFKTTNYFLCIILALGFDVSRFEEISDILNRTYQLGGRRGCNADRFTTLKDLHRKRKCHYEV